MTPREPTPEECENNAPVTCGELVGFACWYPQMGGYAGKCVVLFDSGPSMSDEDRNNRCFDTYVWHDGEFPFPSDDGPEGSRKPAYLHHCTPFQFIEFGLLVARRVR